MRIDKSMPSASRGESAGKKSGSVGGLKQDQVENITKADFKTQLADINQQEIKERLDRLFVIIDEQGEKLKKSLDKKDMLEYKKRVRDFLKILNKEFSRAKQSCSWDKRGNMKNYTIIEKVDKNLEALHQLFVEEQSDALEVLKKIDEIRGMLLDLYI